MKRVISLFLLLFAGQLVAAQENRAVRLFGYLPAPGQFINSDLLGTPEAARRITTSSDHLVSLGSFGGSVVLGFSRPVVNDPRNPYGIDFSIFGNAFDGSSEPGVVWVMKDTNGNGQPDDTWLELAGSSSFHPQVRRNAGITWRPLADGSAAWRDGTTTGLLRKNEFHTQPYYPQPDLFPGYPRDSVTLTGTLLPLTPSVEGGVIHIPTLGFGYADNRPWNRYGELTDPDNPYTPDLTEGAGGDPFDISWAIDAAGNYLFPDQIDFIRIVTAVLSENSRLGEISPEVAAVVATAPTGKRGNELLTVIHPHARRILVGDSLALYGAFFRQGIIVPGPVTFSGEGAAAAMITPEGLFHASAGGRFTLKATPAGFPANGAMTEVTVRVPDTILCTTLTTSLVAGETSSFVPWLGDQFGEEITEQEWTVTAGDSLIAAIATTGKMFTLQALQPGTTTLTLSTRRFPGFVRLIPLTVLAAPASVRVYATAGSGDQNLFPAQWITLTAHSVNDRVDHRTRDYSQPSFISLAQAASALLTRAGAEFRFREEAGGLTLYSVEKEGLFTYGWGGRTDPAPYARAWVFRKNRTHSLSHWESQPVSNGDTLNLYHVNNLLNEWKLSILTSTPDSVLKGDDLLVSVREVTCRFHSPGEITEAGERALPNQPVAFLGLGKSAVFTDSRGLVLLEVPADPPLVLFSGNNARLISPALATAARESNELTVSMFPRPATTEIRIFTGMEGNIDVRMADLSGRIVMRTSVAGPLGVVSVAALRPGVYIAEIASGGKTTRIKVMKL